MMYPSKFCWFLNDLHVSIGPPASGQYWCLDVDISRPSTGERESMLWDINTPGNLARRDMSPTILEAVPFPERDLLVLAGQGIGDVIQQWRYLEPVARQFRQVRVQCRPELQGFLAQQSPAIQVVTREQSRDYPEQARVSLMRLAALCSDPFAGHAYLQAPAPRPSPGAQDKRRLRVGLNWAANASGAANQIKSVPPFMLEQLVDGSLDIDWVSVQWGADEQRLFEQPWAESIERLGKNIADVTDLAQAISGLDLLITVDSAPAHVAGALGVPVWCLLSKPCSWRWGLDTVKTPLYRSMRLVRQSRQGEWAQVLDRLSEVLHEMRHRHVEPGLDDVAFSSPLLLWGAGSGPDMNSQWRVLSKSIATQARPATVEDALRLCCERPDWRAAFASHPLGLLRSLGVPIWSCDYRSLTEIFKAMVDCYGGFPWCSPVERVR